MSARTNYIVAAVAAVAILGAVGGYVYYTQNNAGEVAAEETFAEDTTAAIDVAELDPAAEAETIEIAAAPEAVTVTAIEDVAPSDPAVDVIVEADQPSVEGTATIEAAPAQPE